MNAIASALSHLFRTDLRKSLSQVAFFAIITSGSLIAQPPDEGRGDRGSRWGDRGGFGEGGFSGGFGGGPPMGGSMMGGFDPGAMLARFDRNGNKMLDPDETQGPAGFFLQRMAQSNPKIDLSKPIPLETIAGEFERMRQERMGGGGSWGGSSWGGSSWGGSSWGSSSTPTEQEQSGPKPLVPTFGVPIPPASVRTFGSGGATEPAVTVIDRDIREAEDRLGRYDRNRDGFLTSDELSGGRWSDDPMQYDRNGDGKLSKEELAVRYAKRRIAEEQQQQQQGQGGPSGGGRSMMFMGGGGMMFGGDQGGGGDRGGDRGGNRGGDRGDGKKEGETKGRPRSLRQLSTREKIDKESGKPEWFTRDDKDTDGQVSMSEFAPSWDEGTVTDFAKFDLNADGFITTTEVRKAIANGATRGGSSNRGGSSMASSGRRDSRSSSGSNSSSGAATAPAEMKQETGTTDATAATEKPDNGSPAAAETKPTSPAAPAATASAPSTDDPKFQKMLDWARKQIGKYDKNSDGALTPNEWTEMPLPPKNEWDYDGDGRITAEEYAKARSS